MSKKHIFSQLLFIFIFIVLISLESDDVLASWSCVDECMEGGGQPGECQTYPNDCPEEPEPCDDSCSGLACKENDCGRTCPPTGQCGECDGEELKHRTVNDCDNPPTCRRADTAYTCGTDACSYSNVGDGAGCGSNCICVSGNPRTYFWREVNSLDATINSPKNMVARGKTVCDYNSPSTCEVVADRACRVMNRFIAKGTTIGIEITIRGCTFCGDCFTGRVQGTNYDCASGKNPSCVAALPLGGWKLGKQNSGSNSAFCYYQPSSTSCVHDSGNSLCNSEGQCRHVSTTNRTTCEANSGYAWLRYLSLATPDPNTESDDEIYACCGGGHELFIGENSAEELGVCLTDNFVKDGDVSSDACNPIFNYLHDPNMGDNIWIDFPDSGCCGDDLTDSGSVLNSDTVSYVCTTKSNGEYSWVNTETDAGSIFNITHKNAHWRFDKDINNESTSTQTPFSYVVGMSETSVIACDGNGNFQNMDCDGDDVYCLEYNEIKNIDNRGFLCSRNQKLNFTDEGYESITDDSLPGSPMMFVCGEDKIWSVSAENNNAKLLPPGGHVSIDGNEPWFCTKNGFILASELDELQHPTAESSDGPQGIGYTLTDYACENVDLGPAYSANSYILLDRFWRTGSSCCGNSFVDDNDDVRFEFFSDLTGVGYGQRGCWNNRAVMHDSTISSVPINNWYDNQEDDNTFTRTINLLRFNNDFFDTNENGLNSWRVEFEGSAIENINYEDVFNGKEVTFPEPTLITAIDKIKLRSYHSFNLIKGVEYILLFELGDYYEYDIYDFVNLEIYSSDDAVLDINFYTLPNHVKEELEFLDININSDSVKYAIIKPISSGSHFMEMTIENPEETNEIDFKKLHILPRPAVLGYNGELYVCQNRSMENPFPEMKSTNDVSKDLFNESTISSHCLVKENHVCTPEGIWTESTDHASPSSRDFSERQKTELSKSPNIIEDSSFNRGGSFSVPSCNLFFMSDVEIYNHNNEISTSEKPGINFLSCNNINDYQVLFRDSNDENLVGEYIFSAWVRANPSGRIYTESNSVDILESSNWNRVEVHGIADDNGNFVVTFSGDFEIDMVQLEEKHEGQFERTKYFRTETRRACCPIDSCWNGHECVYMDADHPDAPGVSNEEFFLAEPGFLTNDDERGYICIGGGNFTFSEKVYRWVNDDPLALEIFKKSIRDSSKIQHMTEFGFCEPGSCFVGRNKEGSTRNDMYVIDRQDCASNGTEFYGRYCDNGNWRSKLELVSSVLYEYAENLAQPYSLFCGNYMDVLNYYSFDFTQSNQIEYLNIFDQNLMGMFQNFKIRYLDQACVLKYGTDNNNQIIALALNDGIYPETIYSEEVESVLKYFGLNDVIGTCISDANTFSTCSPDGKIMYNANEKILLYVPKAQMIDSFRDQVVSSYDDLSHSYWIDSLKNSFVNNMTNFNENHYSEDRSMNNFVKRLSSSLPNYGKYDEIFVFKNDEKYLYVAREKHLNLLRRNNAFEYFYMINTSGFEVDIDFYTVGGIENRVISPIYPPKRNITFVDIFNQTTNTIIDVHDDSIYVLYMSPEETRDFFRDWYMFTGRLRGDLRLPISG